MPFQIKYPKAFKVHAMDLHSFFRDKSILVLGGTGTIGSEIVSQLLNHNPSVIRILSNSENELWETRNRFDKFNVKLRYLLGDIRDYERVKRAMRGIDYVFNAAAVKHVPICEYNPMEAINVNIHGLENVLESAINNDVKKLVHISTDKAVSPTTVMGATKMLGERLCTTKSLSKGSSKTVISCVRFGNVLGSRGSIIPLIKYQIENDNEVTLTGEKMQRFFMSLSQAVDLVLKAMLISKGNEIFVLKMPSIRIKDLIEVLVEEYAPKVGKKPNSIAIRDTGPRPGEKFDEELITPIEYPACYELEDMYVVYPTYDFGGEGNIIPRIENATKVNNEGKFAYSTGNQDPMSKDQIRKTLYELNLI